MIGCCALLQLLLGNMGRPGGGIMALRGHASIQGSTDIPTLYHSIHGYMAAPDGAQEARHARGLPRGRDAAAGLLGEHAEVHGLLPEVDVRRRRHRGKRLRLRLAPEDHSATTRTWPMFVAMNDGKVKGMLCIGQNPATSLNARLERKALRKLEWLVVKDNWLHRDGHFLVQRARGQERRGQDRGHQDRSLLLPVRAGRRIEGSFTNTQRMLQWHYKAADPPGDCRSDLWFTHQLAKRLKTAYADSPRRATRASRISLGLRSRPDASIAKRAARASRTPRRFYARSTAIHSGDPGKHLAGFGELKDDGSTTCASWIYCGVFPAPDKNLAASRKADPPDSPARSSTGALPGPPTAASCTTALPPTHGQPWSERKKWVWWDAEQTRWAGYDVPDFAATKAPNAQAEPGGIGLDALSRHRPFHHEGRWPGLAVRAHGPRRRAAADALRAGRVAGRTIRSTSSRSSPVLKYWKRYRTTHWRRWATRLPDVMTTYRLTDIILPAR